MGTYIITIDGGTTNTRCVLWNENGELAAEEKRQVGVRNTSIDGNNNRLKQAVRECLQALMEQRGLDYQDIDRVIGSGMITSDVGLAEIPWIEAPAGRKELAEHTEAVNLPEICPLPIYLIPGIKNKQGSLSSENMESMDVMRGEEVESLAIMAAYPEGQKMLLVLPGSHNKFVAVNQEGKIAGCLTSISGELLASITKDTIIAKSVNRQFVSEDGYDEEWILRGYETAKRTGLGRACFTARIQMLFGEKNPQKLANFVLGAALAGDMQALRNSAAIGAEREMLVVVSGKQPLRGAVAAVLKADGFFERVEEYAPGGNRSLSAAGAYLVAREKGLLHR